MNYTQQTQRIKDKLIKARQADKEFKVFGAKSHQYKLNPPANIVEVATFEEKHSITLPDCYKAFVTQVGNGGDTYRGSGAGPFYGIYPLGEYIGELVYTETSNHLQNDCLIYPYMTKEYWSELVKNIEENENISDEDYDAELEKIFGGILPIGSQGCTYLHGIILNGIHKGKVVNLDSDCQKPHFTFEDNFLDWYERWLDEVISGKLQKKSPSWFGYTMAGSETVLLDRYFGSEMQEYKIDCLDGLLQKESLSEDTIRKIEKEYITNSSEEIKKGCLQILTKFDYKIAKAYLNEYLEINPEAVFKYIFWYAKDKAGEWVDTLARIAPKINDDRTFDLYTYILVESGTDYSSIIIPFTTHTDKNIRITAIYTLGKLQNKTDYLDTFIAGLCDTENRVIHITLQALQDVKSYRLLKYYKQIAEKFPEEEDYILVNLNHRLKDYGLTNETIVEDTASKYSELYKEFSNTELALIIENGTDYRPEAVVVAINELENRNLTDADRQQIEEVTKSLEQEKKRKKEVRNKIKNKADELIQYFNPVEDHKPSTSKLINVISIVYNIIFIIMVVEEFDFISFMLGDIGNWDWSVAEFFIPFGLMPLSALLFGLRKKAGWVLFSLYLSYATITLFLNVLTGSDTSYILGVLFYGGTFLTLYREKITAPFGLSAKTIRYTGWASIGLATLVLMLYLVLFVL